MSQAAAPNTDTPLKTTTPAADPAVVYSETNENFTFTNAIYTEGTTYTTNINGTEISITTADDDGYDNSTTGIAAQFAQAINDAGISGDTATSNAAVVTLVDTITTANAYITSDNGTLETSIATTAVLRRQQLLLSQVPMTSWKWRHNFVRCPGTELFDYCRR